MTPQPMSRRQRREAERAAEVARQLAEAEAGAAPPSQPTPTSHTTHAASSTRRSRRDSRAQRSQTGTTPSAATAPSVSALPDVPVAPQKQNHPQRPMAQAAPPAVAPATRPGTHAAADPVRSAPVEQTGQGGQPQVAPMSRMARRRQSAVEQPARPAQPHPQVPAATGPAAPSAPAAAPAASTAQPSSAQPSPAVPSAFSVSPQTPGETRPTRRSRKDLRAGQSAEDARKTHESPAVVQAQQQPQTQPDSRRSRRHSHAADQSPVLPTPSAPSALSPLVAASLAESTSAREPAAERPAASAPWWTTSEPLPASPSTAQPQSHTAASSRDSAVPGTASRSGIRRRSRASAATPASASVKLVVASTTHHTASYSAPSASADSAPTPTSQPGTQTASEAPVAVPSAPEAPHEIRFSRRITDFRGAETVEVPEVRKLMAARKAGVPLADEAAIRAAKAAQGAKATREARKTKPARTAAATSDEVNSVESSTTISAASKPGPHRDSSTGPTPARPVRRRTGTGILGRTAVLSALAVATVLAPLSSHLDNTPLASAAIKMHAGDASHNPAAAGTKPSSVASAVLGRDDDLEESSDPQLSNVPDAATRARIREAYLNAAKTCSSATGASGDTTAFSSKPQLFYPMLPGTYEISSEYGYRTHPTLGYRKLHAGQDMAAPVGTPIYAAAAGTVTTAGMVDGTGTVTIKHEIDGQVWYTSYLHMYEDGIYVKAGDTVTAGQMIAGVGNTGRSSGAHLHFEVRTKDDTADESTVEPWGWLKEHSAVELTTNCS